MNGKKARTVSSTVALMKFQVGVSALLVVFGIWFPFYIGEKYGNGSFPLYDRFGSVTGEANYLAMSVGVGLFAVAIGAIGILMAKKALKRMRSGGAEERRRDS